MGQLGFFDVDKRLLAISAKGDPLEMIDRVVPFESFRAEIEAAVLTPAEDKKSAAGRKPIDVIVMFRMLVLQSLSTIFPSSRSNIKCVTACRSRGFFSLVLSIAFPTAQRCGCFVRRWGRPG